MSELKEIATGCIFIGILCFIFSKVLAGLLLIAGVGCMLKYIYRRQHE